MYVDLHTTALSLSLRTLSSKHLDFMPDIAASTDSVINPLKEFRRLMCADARKAP